MAVRWLKNKVDGEIYEWDEILANNQKTEEITEKEAFPEKFMSKRQRERRSKINLETEASTEPNNISEGLAEKTEASTEPNNIPEELVELVKETEKASRELL